ncbi:MAG TPA: hypothetical protein VFI31_04665 [Pirellulales bacterium]|nr:hypothetical protein [Pirellulales bacterium]
MRRNREKSLGNEGDSRRAAILKNFRCGARRPWCREIWKSAVKACGGTQDAAAQRLFVTTSAVSEGLQHGRLSIETLVVMMAELSPHGWRLPKLPPREEMMEEGLIEAMAFLLEPTASPRKRRRLSRDDFSILAALMADREWSKALADHEWALASGSDDRLRRAEAKLTASAGRITAAASRRRDRRINHSVSQLRELSRTWSGAWTECQHAIPFAWSDTT